MDELTGLYANGSVVRAIRFPTTVRALRRLDVPHALTMPWGYMVVVRAGRVQLVSERTSTVFLDMATSDVGSIFVAETSSTPPFPQVTLGIILQIRSNTGFVELPVVPISEDTKRLMTWRDADVQRIAGRLRKAIEFDRNGGTPSN